MQASAVAQGLEDFGFGFGMGIVCTINVYLIAGLFITFERWKSYGSWSYRHGLMIFAVWVLASVNMGEDVDD